MIRSTFFGFATAQKALSASQKALDVVGQNISNINTAGYTRQRLDQYSVPSAGIGSRYASKNSFNVGSGVNIAQIAQMRDPFLDVRFRRETPKLGELDAKATALGDLENVFDETMMDGMGAQISDFVKQLQALSGKAGNPEFDGIVKASAETMTKLFNQFSKQIASVREEETFNLEKVAIVRVNDILKNVSELNKSIEKEQVHGSNALELKDQRNMLIDELSTYIKIDVKTSLTEISPGVAVEKLTINLQGADGTATPLVSSDKFGEFSYSLVGGKANVSLIDANQKKGATPINITDNLDSGMLKGYVDMLNEEGDFNVGGSTQKGIGYYQKMLDIIANELATQMNTLNKVPNPNYDATLPDTDPNSKEFFERPLFQASPDPNVPITAENIAISDGWRTNEWGITCTTKDDPGNDEGGNENIEKMIAMFSKKLDFKATVGVDAGGNPIEVNLFKGTIQECLANVGNTLALEVSSTDSSIKNFLGVISGIEDARDSISAVSLDEEGMNLLRYQKSYNAAARLMTTLDEAIDTIINKMGLVGR